MSEGSMKENRMAFSVKAGPLNPPMGFCSVASRSPGPLGINDQGDPGFTSLLGDTPGPLGINDWGAPSLLALRGLHMPHTGGMCAAPDGVALVLGFIPCRGQMTAPATAAAPIALDLAQEMAQEMALKITTFFEGGKSMNYQALADDFDGQGTSFGLIQWNFGQNTLGPLLKKMKAANATRFAGCFGEKADYDTLNKALDDNKQADQLAWARAVIEDNKAAWRETFRALGAVDAFNRIQRTEAAAQYHPKAVRALKSLRALHPDLLTGVEFRSYAALFDLCVQQNSLDKAMAVIKQRCKDEPPTTQRGLLEIAVVERGKKASSAWASDCISRRMGILSGGAYESTEHEITKKRANPQYSLITDHGEQPVTGL
jgi:hypothetical protein